MNSQANSYAKPYYTLEETLKRLKEAGADLDTIADVLIIASEDEVANRLEVKLLCDEPITLVENKQSKIVKLKIPTDFDHQWWLDNYYSPNDIKELISEIESSQWLITKKVNFSEYIGAPISQERNFLIEPDIHLKKNLLVTPKSLEVSFNRSLPDLIQPSSWLRDAKHQTLSRENLAAVEIEGLFYCVCEKKKNPILESYKLVENNNSYTLAKHEKEGEFRENNWLALEDRTIRELIKNKNFVVTGKALHAYVEKSGFTSRIESQNKSKNEIVNNSAPLKPLTWRDLFTNPPKNTSELFLEVCDVVDKYCSEFKSTPNSKQLWKHLQKEPSFKYDRNKEVINDISSRPLDKVNFNKNFHRWTTNTAKKG